MSVVFADTFYFIALLSKQDEHHDKAVAWTKTYTGKLLTTEWVLLELADSLASSKRRLVFGETRRRLLADKNYGVVALGMPQHERGIEMYESRPDKEWSLTDCVSFVTMKEEGIREALTGDHHFEQAGFVALLK